MTWEYILLAGVGAVVGSLFIAEAEKVNLGCFFPTLGFAFIIGAIYCIWQAFANSLLYGFLALIVTIVGMVVIGLWAKFTENTGPRDDGFMNL